MTLEEFQNIQKYGPLFGASINAGLLNEDAVKESMTELRKQDRFSDKRSTRIRNRIMGRIGR